MHTRMYRITNTTVDQWQVIHLNYCCLPFAPFDEHNLSKISSIIHFKQKYVKPTCVDTFDCNNILYCVCLYIDCFITCIMILHVYTTTYVVVVFWLECSPPPPHIHIKVCIVHAYTYWCGWLMIESFICYNAIVSLKEN